MQSRTEARQAACEGAVDSVVIEVSEEEHRRLCALGYEDAAWCCAQGYLTGAPCRGG